MGRVYVLHPLLQPDRVEARDYQVRLAQAAVEVPSLIVLPTGLGKTVIALLAAVRFLEAEPEKRILVLAPTKPLVEQHARAFRELLVDLPFGTFTGETNPSQRDREWSASRIVFATPQVIENDLVRGARDLRDVALVVFDEAHRACGNYAYVFIAKRYREAGGRAALGLTASPGSDIARIQAVLHNLGLSRIEVRTDQDPDVKPYVHEIATEWVRVKPTPTLVRVIRLLQRAYLRCVGQLRRLGHLQLVRGIPNRTDLLDLGHRIRHEAASGHAGKGVFEAVTAQARALKIQHALELAETQGLTVLHHFLARVQAEAEQAGGSRAARDLTRDPEFGEALALARDAPEPHPKVDRAVELAAAQLAAGARRLLVFANYRETADILVGRLSQAPGCRPHRFVGHASASGEKGLTKKSQQEVVERFRRGELNLLVATSVAEEGLDLPETDAVILYEPVPSGIRMIQRRGRTGRRSDGRVFVLVTEGTRDEQYYWSALRREKRMHEELAFLRAAATRQSLLPEPATVPSVDRAIVRLASPLEILVDQRETSGPVAKRLLERGARVKTATLPVGDYVPGAGLVVERKTASDFAASLRDGRLFDQARRLSSEGRAVLVVEGDAAEVAARVASASYLGALASLVADYGIAVVTLPDSEATADFLVSLARRQQAEGPTGAPTLRFQKHQPSSEEELRFIVEGIPAVGPVLAARLLERFGSVAGVTAATVEGLEGVEGVGRERARTIHEVLHRAYAQAILVSTLSESAVQALAVESGNGSAR